MYFLSATNCLHANHHIPNLLRLDDINFQSADIKRIQRQIATMYMAHTLYSQNRSLCTHVQLKRIEPNQLVWTILDKNITVFSILHPESYIQQDFNLVVGDIVYDAEIFGQPDIQSIPHSLKIRLLCPVSSS